MSAGRESRFRRIQSTVKEIEPWGIIMAVIGLFLSLWTFWIDYHDRVEERTVRAWQLLTTKAPGNSGKREALEYLNSEDTWCFIQACKKKTQLIGIDLSVHSDQEGAFLYFANLERAKLDRAKLKRVGLSSANLHDASLFLADLQEANLSDADLSSASLIGADLSGADLREANLSGADLTSASLIGARLGALGRDPNGPLADVKGLTQQQLNGACGDKNTILPDGLTIPMCSEAIWYEDWHGDR